VTTPATQTEHRLRLELGGSIAFGQGGKTFPAYLILVDSDGEHVSVDLKPDEIAMLRMLLVGDN